MRLVGGTALALQLGHRNSVDLDFFGEWDSSVDFNGVLSRVGTVERRKDSGNIRMYLVSGFKVDIVHYTYKWLADTVEEDGVRMASPADIAPMKLEAICKRGNKKDFMDMAALLDHFPLADMIRFHGEKYDIKNEFTIMRSLTYFVDAEDSPMPRMFNTMTWTQAKKRILDAVREYERQIRMG